MSDMDLFGLIFIGSLVAMILITGAPIWLWLLTRKKDDRP